jgi:hypothetical protein
MGLWTVVVSAFVSTWIMMIYRTWSISMFMIEAKQPENLMLKYRKLAFATFIFCMIPLVPFIPQVAVSDKARRRFCIAYVNAITKEET